MKRKLLYSLLIFLALTQAYQNCGGARQFAALDAQALNQSAVLPPADEFYDISGNGSTVLAESTTPVATPTPTPVPSTGSKSVLNPNLQVPPSYKYVIDFYLPFGSISETMKAPLHQALGSVIRNSSCNNVQADQYGCGELPFGSIVDQNRKIITTIDLGNGFQGKNGKESYKFLSSNGKNIDLKIYMSRQQRSGNQVLFYLPTQQANALQMSDKLGENIFFALTPRGVYMDTQICTMIPGIEVNIDSFELKGEARKSDALPFGTDAVAKGSIVIHPGKLIFDQAFACANLQTQLINGVPQLVIRDVTGINFQRSSHQGLKIEKKIKVSGILGFFDNLFNLGIEDKFKDAIQKAIVKKVNKEIEIASNDVKNGVYLSKFIGKADLEPMLAKANAQIQKAFAANGYVAQLSDRVTQAACTSAFASLGLPEQAQVEMTRLCVSPEIKIKALYASPNSHADCFRGYFDPRAGANFGGSDWWKSNCKIVVRTEVTMKRDVLPLISCITDTLKSHGSVPQSCQGPIAELMAKYNQGDLQAILQVISTVRLNEQQINEIRNLVTNQFGSNISVDKLKKIFQ